MPDGLEGEERRQNTLGVLGGIWQSLRKRERRQVMGVVGGPMLAIIGGLFWAGYYFHQFDREYKPIPKQVERLEEHADRAERDVFPQVDSLSATVESMRGDLGEARTHRREIILRLDNLNSKVDNVGCFAEAAAGSRSPYECRGP